MAQRAVDHRRLEAGRVEHQPAQVGTAQRVAEGRREIEGYGGVVVDGRVEGVEALDDPAGPRFRVSLDGGGEVTARRVILATGLADVLPDVVISPGDIDEAVQFLLAYGIKPEVFPNTAASGFELVGAYRDGFLQGGDACDLGS